MDCSAALKLERGGIFVALVKEKRGRGRPTVQKLENREEEAETVTECGHMNAVLLTEADAAVPRRLRTPRNQEPREGSGVDQGWTRQPRARETQGSTPYARPNELRTERRKKKKTHRGQRR